MRYYLAKNNQEYTNPEDCVKYGGGLEGYREVVEKVEKITYEKLTGNEAPLSPVDNVLPTPAPVVPAPVAPAEPVKPIAALFNQPVVLKEHIESTKPTVPLHPEIQTPSPLEAKIEVTQPEDVAQSTVEFEYDTVWLEHLNDEQLRALGKQHRLMGLNKSKRETIIRKLGSFPKKLTETK
jgi:hypothetical protein